MQFVFEDFMLDSDRRELTRGSESIVVGPQVFDVLVYLLRNRERVVGKDDLLNAVWGGRLVSESTMTSHINAVRKAIGDSGAEQRLIRTVARKGFRFVGDVRQVQRPEGVGSRDGGRTEPNEPPAHAPELPERPSIAVLPFLNLSGDPGQDYFADGVVEDIISALSRIRWLFVIARNSSFTYKGRAVDVKQMGRELGVRYVLEGSVRKAANRIRITGQLIDATTGAHLWAERFESSLDDIFELQDQITASVVGTISPQLERAEIERAKQKPTGSLDAYDYYLRGMANLHRGTREAMDEALPLFSKAIQLDPDFASAYAMAAWCHFWRKVNGWLTDRSQEVAEGARLARRAVELGKDDAVALARSGPALAHLVGDLDSGVALSDRALVLNPNLAAAWFLGGFLRILRGEPDDAIERLAHAMRLSPLDPEMYRMQAGTAMAHLLAGRFDTASSWAQKALRDLPSFLIAVGVIAASHALAGRTDEARRAMRHLRQLDPALRVSSLADWLPLHRSQDLATFADGLRKAGLPE
ncbi:MAG TPA: winged helix-turn-helix domain-containing tetratricopeptide repeat protein [Burkholderiales bacterium]|nr:winged helix-turn-helix domain-containing tetratricopeptide repeat protein [Burkholderiales bacterium]